MYVCRHHKIQGGLAGILKPAFSTDDDIIYYNSCCLKTCWFCFFRKKNWYHPWATRSRRDKYKTDSKKSKRLIKEHVHFSDQHSHSLALGLGIDRLAFCLMTDVDLVYCACVWGFDVDRTWEMSAGPLGLISNSYTWTMAAKVRKGGSCVRKRLYWTFATGLVDPLHQGLKQACLVTPYSYGEITNFDPVANVCMIPPWQVLVGR